MDNTISHHFSTLGNSLYNLAINKQSSFDEIITEIKKNCVFNNENKSFSKFACFEGDRCSGKDTIIKIIAEYFADNMVYVAPRKVNNKAWCALQSLKQDCYFSMDNPFLSCLLWYSDLSFRLHEWSLLNCNRYSLINRYYYSIDICINSIFCNIHHYEKKKLSLLQKQLKLLFPKPDITIVLDVSYDVECNRLKCFRNVVPTDNEKKIMKRNLNQFKEIRGNDVVHVNADLDLDTVFYMIICSLQKKINNKDERYYEK